jgi:hypothetical protein
MRADSVRARGWDSAVRSLRNIPEYRGQCPADRPIRSGCFAAVWTSPALMKMLGHASPEMTVVSI